MQKNHKGQGPENTPRKPPREGYKNHYQEQPGTTQQSLEEARQITIHTKEVHTRSSFPPDHPTLSQNLTMKLSS
jgi:hypothetical protein